MNRNDIGLLLKAAKDVTNHTDYVIVGSLSILGASPTPPLMMAGSVDVDMYPKNDPGRASEVMAALGDKSDFWREHGYYADAVSPYLPALPEGYEERLVKVQFENGINAWFLDANDAAVSKYIRGEDRDREWAREGIAAGVLSLATIEYRLRETPSAEMEETQRARTAIAADRAWIERREAGADEPAIHKRLVVSPDGIKTYQTSLDGQEWNSAAPEPAGALRPDTYNLTRSKPVDATKPGPVTGFVIYKDEKYVYQEMGKNNIARHEVRLIKEPPAVVPGQYSRFKYENGKAEDIAQTLQKGKGLSR